MNNPRYRSPNQYSKIRTQNKNEMLEDYVETISELIILKGEARNADLAKHFGVSQATINKNIKRLVALNLVKTEPYRSIFLTDKGQILADYCKKRHEIVYKFLIKIGVNSETAKNDAEGLEHHVSAETLNVFEKYNKK